MSLFRRDLPPPVRHPRVVLLGRVLDFLGQVLFPIGVGICVGFYTADQGWRALPTMAMSVLGLFLSGLSLIALGRWLRGRAAIETPQGTKLRKRVVAALALAAVSLGALLVVWWATLPSDLTALNADEFEDAFAIDTVKYVEHARGMERLVGHLEARGIPAAGDDQPLSALEEKVLLDSWRAMFDYAVDLDQTRIYYENYYRFDPSRVERSYHLRSFLLTYAAELALYEKAARFTKQVGQNKNAVKFLDVPRPELGLPEGSFSRYRGELLGTRDQARVVAGEQYLGFIAAALNGRQEARALGVTWLWDAIDAHLGVVRAVAPIDRASLTLGADGQFLKRGVRRVWFPVQKGTAEFMGDYKTRRIGWYLIDHADVAQIEPKLAPGDILLTRKNWYLSNVGLPGFWPHGLLYLGPPAQLDAYFDDAETLAWVEAESGRALSFSQFMQSRFPTPWLLYQLGESTEDGTPQPLVVIEAISEGVVLNTWHHAAGDYLAAVRPRLSKKAKAQALVEAFSQWGRPYDFDFDFATDHAVVCTELVWRAYRADPGLDKAGLDIPLVQVAGRKTLPANDLVRFYAQQADLPDDQRQLDFVAFLDAIEKERDVVLRDEAAFRASWERTKWDVRQK